MQVHTFHTSHRSHSARASAGACTATGRCRRLTLAEVIVVIMIMGILGALGLAGLDRTLTAVFDGQRNLELTQKAEMATQRLLLEMRFLDRVPGTRALRLAILDGGTRAVYVSKRDGQEHTLQFAGTLLTLDGQPLVDEVGAFLIGSDGVNAVTLSLTMSSIGDFTVEVYP